MRVEIETWPEQAVAEVTDEERDFDSPPATGQLTDPSAPPAGGIQTGEPRES